jgi:hypothetical protein
MASRATKPSLVPPLYKEDVPEIGPGLVETDMLATPGGPTISVDSGFRDRQPPTDTPITTRRPKCRPIH